jgi:hypothetical protein
MDQDVAPPPGGASTRVEMPRRSVRSPVLKFIAQQEFRMQY